MFKFLAVCSISQEKNLLYITINKEEDVFSTLINLSHQYPQCIFFPIMNNSDVLSISEFVDKKWEEALLKEVNNSKNVFGVCIREECIPVYSIQHIKEDVFNIITSKQTFTSNCFKPCLYVENSWASSVIFYRIFRISIINPHNGFSYGSLS